MDILIGADIVPTPSNVDLFAQGNTTTLLGEDLMGIWNSSDARILNLEVPITDKQAPISKCGPNLIAPTSTINGIKALDLTLLTLANNHILDQGIEGLKSTENILEDVGIPFIGAGDDLLKARKPFLLQTAEAKVGIYACAEHEYSIAAENSPGANPFDPLESLDHITALKNECDHVIVLYHGGKEHYRYPSPGLQRVCRKIAERGADLVVCQHSHCIGCFEDYNGSTLVYGQGNFIFDYSDSDFWQTSILIKVSIGNGLNVCYIPIIKAGNAIRLAHGKDADDILEAFYMRSGEILKDGFVEQQYLRFAESNYLSYIRGLAGFGKWLKKIDIRLLDNKLSKRRFSKKQLLTMQNYIECEAHRELLLCGIKNEGKT